MTSSSRGLSYAAEERPPQETDSNTNENDGAWTRYARALAQGNVPANSLYAEAWGALSKALNGELRYRSLAGSSPSYVGVYGYDSWIDFGNRDDASTHPFDEFLHDCFSFIFVERIPQLIARLKINPDIEGDVRLYIRNFVYSRQKTHDPLGSRLFELLRSSVREAQEAKELYVIDGDTSIRNDTVLSFAPRSFANPVKDLGSLSTGWASGAIGDLFSTGPGSRKKAVDRLRRQLLELRSQGVGTFLFQAAIDGLKQDVRAQLAVLFELEQGEAVLEVDEEGNKTWIRSLQPETWIEDIDSYNKLVDCVTKFVRSVEKERTRDYLEALWGFLRRYVTSEDVRMPTHRRLEQILRIPRARVPSLFRALGGFVRDCSNGNSGTVIEGQFRDEAQL